MNDTCFKFEDFPEELQIYILSRLPPKALSICESVSKHWNTTLTIQVFLLRHSRSYDKHSKLAFVKYWTTLGYESVLSFELCDNTTPNRKTMTVPKTTKMSVKRNSWTTEITTEEVIIGNNECFTNSLPRHKCNEMSNICNDLVCLFDRFSTRLGLFNLKTQDFINLPTVPTDGADPITSWYALGFDPVNKVYKVLSIYGGSEVGCTKAEILTLGSKNWKPVEYKFLRSEATMNWRFWRRQNRFCLDGVIYWVNDYQIDYTIFLTVVAFDLNDEVFTDYELVSISMKDVETIRHYLTSLKGCPTLFIWNNKSCEIQQLTLFNHRNPKVAYWNRSFIAHDFSKNFPYGERWDCIAGGNIVLRSLKPIKSSMEPEVQSNPFLSWYIWYDLENLAIE